ncbi:hypothetical protein MRB53_028190 [Persea americana]|uniref:Uncharacterized protein n=1 Tax=Persea americana TaxID=3435 RepID=A0ACC2KEX1_PERAE|nr:hypothetical protein MRB53_028190 [Persea americana]
MTRITERAVDLAMSRSWGRRRIQAIMARFQSNGVGREEAVNSRLLGLEDNYRTAGRQDAVVKAWGTRNSRFDETKSMKNRAGRMDRG